MSQSNGARAASGDREIGGTLANLQLAQISFGIFEEAFILSGKHRSTTSNIGFRKGFLSLHRKKDPKLRRFGEKATRSLKSYRPEFPRFFLIPGQRSEISMTCRARACLDAADRDYHFFVFQGWVVARRRATALQSMQDSKVARFFQFSPSSCGYTLGRR